MVAVKERRFGDEAHNGVVGHGGQPVVPVLQPPGDAWVVPADALHEPPGHEHRGVELVPVRDAHDAKPLGEAPLARHCPRVTPQGNTPGERLRRQASYAPGTSRKHTRCYLYDNSNRCTLRDKRRMSIE